MTTGGCGCVANMAGGAGMTTQEHARSHHRGGMVRQEHRIKGGAGYGHVKQEQRMSGGNHGEYISNLVYTGIPAAFLMMQYALGKTMKNKDVPKQSAEDMKGGHRVMERMEAVSSRLKAFLDKHSMGDTSSRKGYQ
jgi:hypothetical protein